ncbi:Transposase, Mutator family, partial [Brevibacterium jeotgali]
SPDMMRTLLQTMINTLLSADADAVVGAEWGKPSPDRSTRRNGYRHRDLDTRVGTLDVAVPKLRQGTYFPEWLLERRKRAESALITFVADCYLAGVSTRRMAPRMHASRTSHPRLPARQDSGDQRLVEVSGLEDGDGSR